MCENEDKNEGIIRRRMRIPHIGVFFAVLSSIFYSLNIVFAKLLTIHPIQVALSRCFLQYCMLLPFALGKNISKTDLLIGEKEIRLLFWFRGLAGALAGLFLYLSVNNLSAGSAVTLSFLDTVFVPVLGRIFCKETMTILDMLFAAISFCGVVLISKPPFLFTRLATNDSDNAIGVIYAILSALCASGSYLTLRKLGKRVHFLHSVFIFTFVGAIMNLILIIITGEFRYPCLSDILFIVLMSSFAFGGALTLTVAVQNERPGTVAVVLTLQIIIVYAIQVIFLHDIPSVLSLIGSGMILFTSVLIAIRKVFNERKKKLMEK